MQSGSFDLLLQQAQASAPELFVKFAQLLERPDSITVSSPSSGYRQLLLAALVTLCPRPLVVVCPVSTVPRNCLRWFAVCPRRSRVHGPLWSCPSWASRSWSIRSTRVHCRLPEPEPLIRSMRMQRPSFLRRPRDSSTPPSPLAISRSLFLR